MITGERVNIVFQKMPIVQMPLVSGMVYEPNPLKLDSCFLLVLELIYNIGNLYNFWDSYPYFSGFYTNTPKVVKDFFHQQYVCNILY